MREIAMYIYKKYGMLLTEEEIKEFCLWFSKNEASILTEEDMDRKTREYLYTKYKGIKSIHVLNEDLSHLKQLRKMMKQTAPKEK